MAHRPEYIRDRLDVGREMLTHAGIHCAHQSFRIPQRVKLEAGRVYIPKIGWVAVRQSQAVDLPLKSATFKREATGKWHVSLVVEFDLPDLPKPVIETETAVGIDVGFDRFATDSDGG